MPGLAEPVILGMDFLKQCRLGLSLWGEEISRQEPEPEQAEQSTRNYQIEIPANLVPEEENLITEFLHRQIPRFEALNGLTDIVEHRITMKDDRPLKQRYYPRNPAMQEVINTEIDELLRTDRIEPSCSPYSSPIVLVRKKQGSWRLCIDYRQLNEHSVKDAYPLPQINYILDKLRGAQYISTIDLKQGYWQIPMAKDSRPYTAFTVPGRGLFQWKVMPFGLHSAPATFQRALDRVMGPEMEPYAFAYLDDIVVIGRTLREHMEKLRMVFDRLIKANLKINPEKCEFFKESLTYLGHVVSPEGIQTDPNKVSAIQALTAPTNVKGIRQFIGIASWYRRFVPDFSTLSAPLTKLLRKNQKWRWGEEQENAFQELKRRLTQAPVLACPDFSVPFVLQTDASKDGLGVVLCQEIEGEEHVIAYASRMMSEVEQRYSVTEKECLAVVWGIRKMRPYLEGYHFIIVTDHQALKWLNSLDNPSGRLARWAIELQQFDFEIRYRRGKWNVVADALSRQPVPETTKFSALETTTPECSWYTKKIQAVQRDPAGHPDFMIQGNQLYRRIYSPSSYEDDETSNPWKLCVPKTSRARVLRENHDDPTAGHGGVSKTICRIAKNYYWPGMFRDIAAYVRSCDSCLRYKPLQQKMAGEMYMTESTEPWSTVSVDFMGPFPRSLKGNTMIVIFQDKFTKWIEVIALREATTPALIKVFRERIYGRYGSPRILISDNGRQFTSGQFKKLLRELGITHRLTPPYTPQANPVERTNRVIKTMIAQYVNKNQRKWDEYLPEFMLAYNTSKSEVTGFSPAYLNFGREPIPPTSLYAEENCTPRHQYHTPGEKHEKLQEIYKLVNVNLGKAFEKQRHHYNLRRRAWCPQVGDLVLRKERILSSAQRYFSAKLAPKYDGPYTVTKIISPVIVSISNQQGKTLGHVHVKDLKAYTAISNARPVIDDHSQNISSLSTMAEKGSPRKVTGNNATTVRKSLSATMPKEKPPRKAILINATADPTVRKRVAPQKIPTSKRTTCSRAVLKTTPLTSIPEEVPRKIDTREQDEPLCLKIGEDRKGEGYSTPSTSHTFAPHTSCASASSTSRAPAHSTERQKPPSASQEVSKIPQRQKNEEGSGSKLPTSRTSAPRTERSPAPPVSHELARIPKRLKNEAEGGPKPSTRERPAEIFRLPVKPASRPTANK